MGARRRIIDFFKRFRRKKIAENITEPKRTPLAQPERNSINPIIKFLRHHHAELPELVKVHNTLIKNPEFYERTLTPKITGIIEMDERIKTNIDQMETIASDINKLNILVTRAQTVKKRMEIINQIKLIQHEFDELKLQNLLILANHFRPTKE